MSRSNVANSARIASTRAFTLAPPALRPGCATFRSPHRSGPLDSRASQRPLNPGERPSSAAATQDPPSVPHTLPNSGTVGSLRSERDLEVASP